MYQRGKIYKIISESTDLVYVGSSIEKYLSQRLRKHRVSYTSWQQTKKKYIGSFEILQHNDEQIVLLENYPCTSKDELRAREQFYIEKFTNDGIKICNKKRAFLSKEHKNDSHKKYAKTEKGKAYRRKYYNNSTTIKNYNQTDKVKEYRKEYRKTSQVYKDDHKQRAKINGQIKFPCSDCGSITSKQHFTRHSKSKHHRDFVQLNENIKTTDLKYEELMKNNPF